MIYVASPYSHAEPAIRQLRYEQVRDWTMSRITRTRESLFSPIVYMHDWALTHDLPKDAEFWSTFNDSFILNSDRMYVLQLDGWKSSIGVTMEILLAGELQLPIDYFTAA